MSNEKMDKKFQRILDKYGIKNSNNSSFYYYQGSWILDYYGKDYYGNDAFALMTKVNKFEFDKLEEVRTDYTTTEFDNKLNHLIIGYKKAKMKQKLDKIKKDFQ